MNSFEETIEKINFLKDKQKTILIAIDGFGGSGKTITARRLKEKFPEAVIVQMDDFYSPKIKGADYKRVLDQVIRPFKNNQTARYKIYDWKNDKFIEGNPIKPNTIVIIEGVFSLHKELIDNYDIKIWVEYPQELGIERGIARDGEEHRNKWENEWGPREISYKEIQKPNQKADFIIDGANLLKKYNLVQKFYLTHYFKRININGIDWEYIVSGKGKKTVVIFPGGGQTAQSNFRLIEELEDEYKVIAINIYNCDSIDNFNLAVNKILDKEKITKVNLYGLSLGGLLAQSYLLRNKNRVESIVLSHACTPKSITYRNKVILPLRLLKIFLPFLPSILIKWGTGTFARKVQGGSNKTHFDFLSKLDPKVVELNTLFLQEFRSKYLTKRLLKTWINLHLDFYHNEKFTNNTFKEWGGKTLVIRTDNDPLIQDEGDFKIVYPNAKVYTLKGTGHLTFYYKFDEIIKVIKNFFTKPTSLGFPTSGCGR